MAKQSTGYTVLQLSLHWLIVLLVLFQLIFGEDMGTYNDLLHSGQDAAPLLTGYYLHLGVGVEDVVVEHLHRICTCPTLLLQRRTHSLIP